MRAPALLSPLRHGQFKYIAASQLVASLGDWLSFVAVLSIVAYEWDLGAQGLAVVSVAQALPWLLAGFLSGVVADRYPRKPLLVLTNLARAACVLALVVAPGIVVLAGLLAVKSALSALFTVTEATAVKDTVPTHELVTANALTSLVNQSSKIIGPAIGGLLFAVVGASSAFVVNSITFLVAAALLSNLRLASDRAVADAPRERLSWTEVTAGFRFVAGVDVLRIAMLSLSLTVFLAFVFDTLTPLLITDLGLDTQMLGVSIASIGAGSTLGALAIGQWAQDWPPLRLMGVAQVACGVLVALAGTLAVSGVEGGLAGAVLIVTMVGVGVSAAGIFIGYPTVIQSATPAHTLGRVMAVAQVLPTSLQLMAPVVAAGMAGVLDVGMVFVLSGGALTLVGVGFLRTRASGWRPAAEPDEPEEPDERTDVGADDAAPPTRPRSGPDTAPGR